MLYVDTINTATAKKAREALINAPQEMWERYDNPFEQKWVITGSRARRERLVEPVLHFMQDDLRGWLQLKLGYELVSDSFEHFTSLFRYEVDDYLCVHADAGVCPKDGLRKKITVLLYLSTDDVKDGDLQFWAGDSLALMNPVIKFKSHDVPCKLGTFVVFENDDFAWHGNPLPVRQGTKFVITASYLSRSHEGHKNMRTHAYFVPRPQDKWSPEQLKLRNERVLGGYLAVV